MIRQLTAFAGAIVLSIGLAGTANAASTDQNPPIRTEWMPCGAEDARSCVWDADHRGNGLGASTYTSYKGRVWKIPHHIAHALLYGDSHRSPYRACETPVSSDPVSCIWEERVWLGREGNDTLIPASIGRYLLHGMD